MIIVEMTESGLTHTYSDAGYKIRQLDTGVIYDDVIDIVHHEYEETDTPIEESNISDEEALRIIVGGGAV